jgi:catechol 2,3-dioxygenase-like lactoylglutathione lyase family enzyme
MSTTKPVASLTMVNLDCRDPRALAAFYAGILGWEVTYSEEEYAMISGTGTSIGFGRVEGYEPPVWPDAASPKRYHLDLQVDDLAGAEQACRELGAKVPDFQPGAERWHVLLDPAGHPFCLSPKPPAS